MGFIIYYGDSSSGPHLTELTFRLLAHHAMNPFVNPKSSAVNEQIFTSVHAFEGIIPKKYKKEIIEAYQCELRMRLSRC